MKNKSKPFICSVYYQSKWRMDSEERKNNISRKKELRAGHINNFGSSRKSVGKNKA